MDNISILLCEIKSKTGWSESKLAAQIGISQPTVNRILRGQTQCMSGTLVSIQSLHREKCVHEQIS
ncbi:helix-turn-helix domain-containing protein [Undibacterium sp. FT147W]|uniref:Helix-turn-helix domain-containing protein n=1 Tax=Undibacterium rivi TaxID=2828729 RepID=A0ABS5H0U3_9BURK|nr:helix-turn-helix domain-containing protein [Undibacterium rivi]